jgi:outer membrane protein
MKRVLLSIIALAVFATGALAELKMGYIDSEVLKERLPEFRDAQRKLDQLRQDYENQAKDREAKLVKLQEDFRRQEMLMSEGARRNCRPSLRARCSNCSSLPRRSSAPKVS